MIWGKGDSGRGKRITRKPWSCIDTVWFVPKPVISLGSLMNAVVWADIQQE